LMSQYDVADAAASICITQLLMAVDSLWRRGCEESAADLLLTVCCPPGGLQAAVGEAAYMLVRPQFCLSAFPLNVPQGTGSTADASGHVSPLL